MKDQLHLMLRIDFLLELIIYLNFPSSMTVLKPGFDHGSYYFSVKVV